MTHILDIKMKKEKSMEKDCKYLRMVIYILENMNKVPHKDMANIIGIVVHFIEASFFQE